MRGTPISLFRLPAVASVGGDDDSDADERSRARKKRKAKILDVDVKTEVVDNQKLVVRVKMAKDALIELEATLRAR